MFTLVTLNKCLQYHNLLDKAPKKNYIFNDYNYTQIFWS